MRRTPLARRAPLQPRRDTHRTPVPGLSAAPALDLDAARAALAHQATSAAAERVHRPVADPKPADRPKETGEFSPLVRATILDRDHMTCQRHGGPVSDTWPGYSLQHRKARQAGGTNDPRKARTSNGVLLCGDGVTGCHGWVEANPALAERDGFAVASWADPETVPMRTYAGWVLLDARGNAWPTACPPGGDAHELAQRAAPLPAGDGDPEDLS